MSRSALRNGVRIPGATGSENALGALVVVRRPAGRRTPVGAACPRDFASPTVVCFASESAAGVGVSTDDAVSPGAGGPIIGGVSHVAVLVSSCSDSLIVVAAI